MIHPGLVEQLGMWHWQGHKALQDSERSVPVKERKLDVRWETFVRAVWKDRSEPASSVSNEVSKNPDDTISCEAWRKLDIAASSCWFTELSGIFCFSDRLDSDCKVTS